MDSRFVAVWMQFEERRQAGEPLPSILAHTRTPDLIAALAGAGERDPVAANILATELLNRTSRAPLLGASLVSAAFVIATFLIDTIVTGSPLLTLAPSSTRGYIITGIMAASAVVSALMYVSWRGRFPRVSYGLQRLRERRRRRPF